jgi:hypothetical protein
MIDIYILRYIAHLEEKCVRNDGLPFLILLPPPSNRLLLLPRTAAKSPFFRVNALQERHVLSRARLCNARFLRFSLRHFRGNVFVDIHRVTWFPQPSVEIFCCCRRRAIPRVFIFTFSSDLLFGENGSRGENPGNEL